MSSSPGTRPGRPPGSGASRDRILAAARNQFGSRGFRGATLRSIAAEAGVDVALVAHYFGNKDGLFAATIELPEQAPDLLVEALSGPIETQGERLTRAYLMLWEDPATAGQMRSLTRSALSNDVASSRVRMLVGGTIAGPRVDQLLAGRRTGFVLAMSHLVGVAFTRHLARIPATAEIDLETLVARTAPAVQLHLSTPDDAGAS